MTTKYTTKQGDTVDEICHRYYGATSGAVEAVLEANPGLAEQGIILPAGVVVVLPTISKPESTSRVTLY